MDGWDILVESTIDAVHVDILKKEIRIDVTCAWNPNDHKQIIATGVDNFVVNEMRLTNVIDRVTIFDSAHSREDDAGLVRLVFFLLRGQEPSSTDLEWPTLQEKLTLIRVGALRLLEIEPVYGASVLVLAADFCLKPNDQISA